MTHTNPPISSDEALAFCEMVEEIGMPDDTIIPVWPTDTEMCLTHPLTVGMVKTFKEALFRSAAQLPEVRADMQEEIDALIKAIESGDNDEMLSAAIFANLRKSSRTNKVALNPQPAPSSASVQVVEAENMAAILEWLDVVMVPTTGGSWSLICGESIIAENLDATGAKVILSALRFFKDAAQSSGKGEI